jgi:NAD(P)-dependent dehydrogenase (short-subunit alcohol dehydrogenase family)
MGRLDGKVALVTGAARGVGRALAVAFAREGAQLALLDLCAPLELCPYPMGTAEQLAETVRRCEKAGARVRPIVADVRSRDQVDRAARAALDEFGHVDVLVNNAGIVAPGGRKAHELAEEEWQLHLDVNLSGAWRCSAALLPQMLERGGGSIVNIGSTGSVVGFPAFAGYVAAKHGLVGLTKALAADYGPRGVRVNAVCPTSVRDDPDLDGAMLASVAALFGATPNSYAQMSVFHHPMGSLVEAWDVASAALWLASDEAARVTGSVVMVDAGYASK